MHLLPAYVLRVWALQGGLSPKAKALSPSPLPTGGHCHTVLLTKNKAELRDGGSPELCFSALYDVTEKQLSCCVSVPPRVKQSHCSPLPQVPCVMKCLGSQLTYSSVKHSPFHFSLIFFFLIFQSLANIDEVVNKIRLKIR